MAYLDLDIEIVQTQKALREMGFDATADALGHFMTINCHLFIIAEVKGIAEEDDTNFDPQICVFAQSI